MTTYERSITFTIVFLSLAMVVAVVFSMQAGSRIVMRFAPLAETVDCIMLEVTSGHLWVEELLSGDPTKQASDVVAHLEKADALALTLLEGGKVHGHEIVALRPAELRGRAQELRKRLSELRALADRRLEDAGVAGAGSDLDQDFDRGFEVVIVVARNLRDGLEAETQRRLTGFRHLQIFIFILVLASAIIVLAVLLRVERRRRRYLQAIEEKTEALRASQERLDLAMHGAELGAWDYMVETDEVVVDDRWARMLGYELDEVEHTLLFWKSLAHPDDLPMVLDVLESHLDGECEAYETEHRLLSKGGDWIWVLDRGRVVERDAEGRPLRLAGTHLDITDRKREEAARRLAEQKLALHVELTPLGVIQLDTNFLVTAWNPAAEKIFGYSREEVLGRRPLDLIIPDSAREHVDQVWAALMDAKGGNRSTNENVTRDGRSILCEWYNTPLINGDGQVIAVASLVQDITERRHAEEERLRAEARLQHAQKLESLGVLAGGIAHDFNNILMAILGYADLALYDLPADAPARTSVQEVVDAARHAAGLAKQMLAYSGRGRFEIENIALGTVVRDMANLLEVSVSKKAALRFELAQDLPFVDGDVSQLRQIIMNLVVNASEAIGEQSGVISISTGSMSCDRAFLSECYLDEEQREGLYVFVEVADNGCGMDRSTLARVFDPFFSTKFTGRGLGMAAVLGIVRGHGGAIKVYSELGKGTTFKVLIPAVAGDGAVDSQDLETSREAAAWRGSGTVLVADDEETICALAGEMLQRLGFEVLTAADGREAVDCFREHRDAIDCVLLDLTMPHMDGEEAFRGLRRIRSDVKVILSSGYNEQDVVQRFAGKGLAGFIQKPYQLDILAAKLKDVLG